MAPQQALESARDYLWQQSQQRHQRQWLEQMISRQPGLCG
jgi:peptidyl-prolyl cis-trans isomerase C